MKYRITFILFIAFFFSGCLKDRLKGDKEILVGKWGWTETIQTTGYCSGSGTSNYTISPTNTNNTYRVEFFKKGKILLYENNKEVESGRIKFRLWKQESTNNYKFDILINGKTDKELIGNASLDTLILYNYYFPFDKKRDCNDCCTYASYFTKQ